MSFHRENMLSLEIWLFLRDKYPCLFSKHFSLQIYSGLHFGIFTQKINMMESILETQDSRTYKKDTMMTNSRRVLATAAIILLSAYVSPIQIYRKHVFKCSKKFWRENFRISKKSFLWAFQEILKRSLQNF